MGAREQEGRGKRRQERLGDLLKEALATLLLSKTKDPRLSDVVITRVKATGDLQIARVFYVLQNQEGQNKEVQKSLARATGFLRSALAKELNLRSSPQLQFFFDESLIYSRKIETLLQGVLPAPGSEPE